MVHAHSTHTVKHTGLAIHLTISIQIKEIFERKLLFILPETIFFQIYFDFPILAMEYNKSNHLVTTGPENDD